MRVPQFYILPKIRKHLPVGFPRRPIVSACNSYKENISKYIDYILQLWQSGFSDNSSYAVVRIETASLYLSYQY